jgi:glycosyltransferase involved in cell wall biosynthesis
MPNSLRGLRVCYFGHYAPEWHRNRVLAKALRRAGAEVIQASDSRRYLQRSTRLLRGAFRTNFDVLLVGFPGHSDMPLARLIASVKRVPLLFDAHVSFYDSSVFTRRTVRPGSLGAWRYYGMDRLSCALADRVILDAEAHIDYFVRTFGVDRSKCRRIWVGADDEIVHPLVGQPQASEFSVFWYGSFFALHGIEHILEAARLLRLQGEAARFELAGAGPQLEEMRASAARMSLDNVTFLGHVPYADLPAHAWKSHISLGVFGDTPQTFRVIPNKVYDGLAMNRAVITADTPAIREALQPDKHVVLVPIASGRALADAIVTLKRDEQLRERIAQNGYELFHREFSIDGIARLATNVVLDALSHPARTSRRASS